MVGDLYFFASDDLLLLPWAGGRQWRQGHPCASGGNYDGGGGVLVGALGDFGAMVPALGGGQGRASTHLTQGSIRGCVLPL